MMQNYFARLFISKNTGTSECGQLAFEVPRAFFPQGYISACGDATLRHDFNNVWARLPSSLAPSFVAVPGLLESGLEQQQATHTMLFTL